VPDRGALAACRGGYPRGGDEAHAQLAACAELDFLAEVYLKTDGPPVSVTQAGGLV
jgi:hypothetical protein